MIEENPPTDWKILERTVARLLRECGFYAKVGKSVRAVRGSVSIDVYAEDRSTRPWTVYLCECKCWNKKIPKTVVHAFRTLLGDVGANWGFLISSQGFQSGARQAAAKSQIRLLSWSDFEALFEDRWIQTYFVPALQQAFDPLIDYTEPINTRVFRKADQLDEERQREFGRLRSLHAPLANLALALSAREPLRSTVSLPLKQSLSRADWYFSDNIPPDVLDANSWRTFLTVMTRRARRALAEFDAVFGERA